MGQFLAWKKGLALVAVLVSASLTAPAWAEEDELSPTYTQCMINSDGSTGSIMACLQEAYDYWDAELNANYKAAQNYCNLYKEDEGAEAAQDCLNKLKTAQRNWLKYRDGMAKVSSFTSANRGGSMESIDVLYNQVLIVRAQALLIAPPSLE